MFSTAYPYECSTRRYENDNVIVTSPNTYGSDVDIRAFLMNPSDSKPSMGHVTSYWVQYEFKTPIIPKQIYIKGNTTGSYCFCSIQYLIDGQWVEQISVQTSGKNIDDTLKVPETKISGIKVLMNRGKQIGTSAPFYYLKEINIYYDTSSPMIQTNVKNVIMQNTFFQKVTSPVEIIED